MKKPKASAVRSKTLYPGLLLLAAPLAQACDMQLSEPDVDYGHVRLHELLPDGAHGLQLGAREVELSIVCEEPRRFALRLNAPAGGLRQGYAMGETGDVVVRLGNVRADDRPAVLRSLEQAEAPSLAFTGSNALQVVAPSARTLHATLRLDPRLSEATRASGDEREFSLQGTLELVDVHE